MSLSFLNAGFIPKEQFCILCFLFSNLASIGHCMKSVQIQTFFLVRIFLYSDWIQENMDQKKLPIWTLFTQCKKIELIAIIVIYIIYKTLFKNYHLEQVFKQLMLQEIKLF